MPRGHWNPITNEQRLRRGLDPKRPADAAEIAMMIEIIRAEKEKRGESTSHPPTAATTRACKMRFRGRRS